MSACDDASKGICILSFDSGGPGTYSQLLIIKEYMSRLANDLGVDEEDAYPADHFDLMGGVGFGGLVAVMLGHLKMNVDKAIDALIIVATTIFPEGSSEIVDQELNSKNLKEAVESMLQTRGVSTNTKMYERDRLQASCKVILYAATSADINHPQLFRTYAARGSSLNPTIVEAVCATMAVPSHFSPVKIGPRFRQQSFIGGASGANNPTRELLNEASVLFGEERRVAQVISIGSGLPRVLSFESPGDGKAGHRLLADVMADCEIVARELAARLYDVDVYLRLSVDRGMEGVNMEDWDGLGGVETHTNAYIGTTKVTKALDASLRRLRERVGVITLGQINRTSNIKVAAKTAPPVSPYFVLRIKEWDKLVWHLVTSPSSRQRILPITGMGGCGKTQLVSYFLQEYPSLFKHVAYVDASSLASIKADLQEWGRALGDGHERDLWEDAIRIISSDLGNERWGLILNNADNPTLNLAPFIPKNINLTVIITSRNRNLSNLSTTYHMELGEMEPNEALTTLLHAARRQLPLSIEESESAHILLKKLGCLAVALVQAGTYCHELSYSFTQYLSLFRSHRSDLMKRAEPSSLDNYERGAYTTLDLSYSALPQTAREFLRFISFFHHTDIPFSALTAAAAIYKFGDGEWSLIPRPDEHASITAALEKLLCVDGTWSEMQVQDTLRTLRSFSLLSITSMSETIFLHLHPLIQAWSRDMDPSTAWHYRLMAAQITTSCSRDAEFRLYRHLVPHILDVLGQAKSAQLHIHDLMAAGKILSKQGHYQAAAGVFEAALEVMENAGEPLAKSFVSGWLAEVYRAQGQWSEAEKLGVEVLGQRRLILGNEQPETIRAAAHLAETYRAQGRWSEAEKLEVNVLEQRKRILGNEHPHTIMAAANLAATYHAQGRWEEAEKVEVGVLEQSKRTLGSEHPDTISAVAWLAAIYYAQGRWSEAEKLQVDVLAQQKRILGPEHPETITSAASLAATCFAQGRSSEAEKLQTDVLEKHKRILGNEHPNTLWTAAWLAAIYQVQGRWSEAEKLEVDVLEQHKRILGSEHPNTISVAANLATTYRAQGRWSEAEKLELDALEQHKKILGSEHPNTISVAANLATTYRAQGRWSEAEELEVEVLEQKKRILRNEHPDTIMAAANLAATYHAQGRWDEAEKVGVDALEQHKRILGSEHPNTISVAANLAATYHAQGRWSEAEKLQVDVLEQQKRILGPEHPDTIMSAASLAATCFAQDRWSEAERLQMDVLERYRRSLGNEHPDTIWTAAWLAAIYHVQGRWSEAEKLEVDALEQHKRILGSGHPNTISVAANLATTYHAQGRWGDAEKLQVDVLERRKGILGNEHPNTIMSAANLAATYHAQGRWREAEKLRVDVLEQYKRIAGNDHPETIMSAAKLASTYHAQGRWSEAETLQVDVLETRKMVLGNEHPDTIMAAAWLAATYHEQGRWNEAEKLQVEVLEQRKGVLGNEHPDTLYAATNLASTYGRQGRREEDIALLAPAVRLSLKVLGQQHPSTQSRLRRLVRVYERLGKEREAQETRELLIS